MLLASAGRSKLRAWVRARRLRRIERTSDAAAVERFLATRDEAVRDGAARRLVALEPPEAALATVRRLEAPGARALARALGARDPALVLRALEAERDPRLRLSWAMGAPGTGEGMRVLVAALADGALEDEERGGALDALEGAPRSELRGHVLAALAASELPTPELLWALSDSGEAEDALLAARHVAAPSFAVASSACEAIFALLERGDPGPSLRELVTRGRARIREAHPPRDNPLADDLVARLDEIEARLGKAAVPA